MNFLIIFAKFSENKNIDVITHPLKWYDSKSSSNEEII